MSHAEQLLELELPVLVGISRKSMIFKLIGGDPTTSLNGTTALNTISLMKGASILRVHEWQTFRNFAIVKQNKKINSLDRKKFFPGQEKNDECGMWNVE